ncbi:hypothetical protein BaRGS_00029296 [Batillaria attramentaria]|uniref:Uncharacterized protein n=1 Tax=Batillaria attramentaria TaxID=370345 RepID=A0ABD0JWK2_9CAEN
MLEPNNGNGTCSHPELAKRDGETKCTTKRASSDAGSTRLLGTSECYVAELAALIPKPHHLTFSLPFGGGLTNDCPKAFSANACNGGV